MDVKINQVAKGLNRKGLEAFRAGNLLRAEELFREALEEDANFGPAHNNLGQLYLARHELYLAAWEFEYAARLLPALVEPIINQGLVYETAERLDQAAALYATAYERAPTHHLAIASLVRVRIKQNADPVEIATLLDQLILHDSRPRWVTWAKHLRATKYRTDDLFEIEMAAATDDSPPIPSTYFLPPDIGPSSDLMQPGEPEGLAAPDPDPAENTDDHLPAPIPETLPAP